MNTRRRWRSLLTLVVACGLVWGAWLWWRAHRYHRALDAARAEIAAGWLAVAARDLTGLLEREPGSDEAAYLLGCCELARGRNKPAVAAWARVPARSEFSHQAILARMRLEHDAGRFAAAEKLINDAAADPRADRSHVRFLLVPIYSQLGRLAEAARLIEDWWARLNETGEGASERAIDLVRMHIELSFRPSPVDDVRAYLDRARALAPNDDRVCLGRANLAIRTGAFADAGPWLDACRQRRPDDAAVRSAWLSLGMATNRVDAVTAALAQLPAAGLSAVERHRARAWLARKRGDADSERHELTGLLAVDPADLPALDRLAELTKNAGERALAADLAAKKAEILRLRCRYEELYDRKQPIRDAVEMAQIAGRLGRSFEARVFLTIALAEDPYRADLRRRLESL